jgi:SH3-like domain-containing protein
LGFALIIFLLMIDLSRSALAEPVCVTAVKANLHTGPGVNYPVSWTVGQHMPLMRIAKKGAWSQVKDCDGEIHWISSSALSPNVACAVIKSKVAKLMKGPGSKYQPADLAVADKYTPFRKVDRDGQWLLVRDEYKAEYWIHENDLWIPVVRSKIAF